MCAVTWASITSHTPGHTHCSAAHRLRQGPHNGTPTAHHTLLYRTAVSNSMCRKGQPGLQQKREHQGEGSNCTAALCLSRCRSATTPHCQQINKNTKHCVCHGPCGQDTMQWPEVTQQSAMPAELSTTLWQQCGVRMWLKHRQVYRPTLHMHGKTPTEGIWHGLHSGWIQQPIDDIRGRHHWQGSGSRGE
jgi:hypothetical protein